jgi:hypothetical protein
MDITGVIDKHTMRLADGVTIIGDVTISDDLVLSKISDDGNAITMTNDGSTRTITGSGSIEASTLSQTPNQSLTGMTGTIGSAVTNNAGVASGAIGSGVTGSPNLNLENATFPAGMPIQVKGDTYVRTSGIVITTSDYHKLGGDLEVSITCKSTNNYLAIWLMIPQFSTENANRGIKVGLRYSTDTFSSSDVTLGEREYIDTYIGWFNGSGANQLPINLQNWVQVPTVSPIKIRCVTKALGDQVQIFGNSSSSACVASLIVQEIQG